MSSENCLKKDLPTILGSNAAAIVVAAPSDIVFQPNFGSSIISPCSSTHHVKKKNKPDPAHRLQKVWSWLTCCSQLFKGNGLRNIGLDPARVETQRKQTFVSKLFGQRDREEHVSCFALAICFPFVIGGAILD